MLSKETLIFVDKIPGWLSQNEGLFLLKAVKLTKKLNGAVVEIGSFHGKSTIWLAQTKQNIYAVDPHKGNLSKQRVKPSLNKFLQNLKIAGVKNHVIPIVKTSAQAAKEWLSPIKVLFIDGLHDEKNALLDYKLWSPFLTTHGFIAMHDSFCGFEGAQKVALKYIVNSNQYYEIGVVGSIIYGVKGKSSVIAKVNKFRCQHLINFSINLNRQEWILKTIRFIIIHRIIKFLLINRFTIKRK